MKDAAARAESYRNKAEETRVLAEFMRQPEVKAFLHGVAQDYLNMAAILDRAQSDGESLPDLTPLDL
jgi:hypothetical protein